MDNFPSLSSSASAQPEQFPLEPSGDYAKRLAKWRLDNAKWAGQMKALRHLDPLPQTTLPRAPWMSESEAAQF